MKDFAFKMEVEDEHLDNFLFLLMLIAARCPKSLKRPYDLNAYMSYISKIDLSKSRLMKDNPGLKFMFECLKKGGRYKPADNIKLELNKEFHKRIFFYNYYLRNAALETLSIVLLFLNLFIIPVLGIELRKVFSASLLSYFVISVSVFLSAVPCFLISKGNVNALVNLSRNSLDDKIIIHLFNRIKFKSNNIKTTFRYLPVSRKALFIHLEKERQSMKKDEPIIIEKKVEVEKPVIIEKEVPAVYLDPDITTADYIESNDQLQKLFQLFPRFRNYYLMLCSKIPEGRKESFILYNGRKRSLQWNGDQKSLVCLFFEFCSSEFGMSENAFKPITDTFLNKSGKEISPHQLKVVANNEDASDTSKDSKFLKEFFKNLEVDV